MEVLPRRLALAYVAFVAVGVVVGARVLRPLHVHLDASPFVGAWRWPVGAPLVLPLGVGVAVVTWGPALAARLSWRSLPPIAGAAAVVWAVSLAVTDGWSQLTVPLTSRFEYEPFAARLHHPGEFLRTFVDRVPGYPIHVQGHPPGAVLVPWVLDRVGLSGAGWFAALVLASWGAAVAAVLVALRTVAGEAAARRAAPALVLLPAAVWAATSVDALFTGVLAVGICVAVLGRRAQALAGGVLLGLALLLTYGGAVLLLVPVAVHVRQRRWAHAALVPTGAGAVLLLTWATTGFWWLDGLRATRTLYWAGVAAQRPSAYLAGLGNPTALAVAVGPAAAVGLCMLVARRRWREALLPLAAFAAVALADLSLLSKGEVERIWLPFAVWIGAAAIGDRRGWLAAQAATGLAVQAVLVSPW